MSVDLAYHDFFKKAFILSFYYNYLYDICNDRGINKVKTQILFTFIVLIFCVQFFSNPWIDTTLGFKLIQKIEYTLDNELLFRLDNAESARKMKNISFSRDVTTGIIYVGGLGPNNYTSIQAGINAASSGCMVVVYPGLYREHIIIDKEIILSGMDRETTIIDGVGASHVVTCTNNVCIHGFTIQGSGLGTNIAGLLVGDHCRIFDCIIRNNSNGIMLIRVFSNIIYDCFIHDNSVGVLASFYSGHNIFMNCEIQYNSQIGVLLEATTNNCIFEHCVINENMNGVICCGADECSFRNCIISKNTLYGCYLEYAYAFTLQGNSFSDNFYDFTIEGQTINFQHTIDTSNTVNDKPIYYLSQYHNQVVSGIDAGCIILVDSTNITLCDSKSFGVLLSNSSHCTLSNIHTHNCKYGVLFTPGHHIKIIDSYIHDTYIGVYLTSYDFFFHIYSSYNCIKNNRISNNTKGVMLSMHSHSNIVRDNQIEKNIVAGVQLELASHNTLKHNTIQMNERGIYVYSEILLDNHDGSRYNTLTENLITKNMIGVEIRYIPHPACYFSDNNRIYHNAFISNIHQTVDECNNYWNDTYLFEGNYWSDYTGGDADGDGIGDTPYTIPGADNRDHYPLMYPYLLGDMNVDGVVTFDDIDPWVLACNNPIAYQNQYRIRALLHGDCNHDGHINYSDVDFFVQLFGN